MDNFLNKYSLLCSIFLSLTSPALCTDSSEIEEERHRPGSPRGSDDGTLFHTAKTSNGLRLRTLVPDNPTDARLDNIEQQLETLEQRLGDLQITPHSTHPSLRIIETDDFPIEPPKHPVPDRPYNMRFNVPDYLKDDPEFQEKILWEWRYRTLGAYIGGFRYLVGTGASICVTAGTWDFVKEKDKKIFSIIATVLLYTYGVLEVATRTAVAKGKIQRNSAQYDIDDANRRAGLPMTTLGSPPGR